MEGERTVKKKGREQEIRRKVKEYMIEKRTTAERRKEGKEKSKKEESARGKERRGICPSGAKRSQGEETRMKRQSGRHWRMWRK